MKVSVEYDFDLKKRLSSDGITEEGFHAASEAIQKLFRKAAHWVYLKTLEKPLPDVIVVEVKPRTMMGGQTESDESVSARCVLRLDDEDPIKFHVNESLVTGLLKGEAPARALFATVTHEVLHGADAIEIRKDLNVLADLKLVLSACFGPEIKLQRCKGLHLVLLTLHHFRAEGVAMLGTCLLMKCRFEAAPDDRHIFRRIFIRALRQATKPEWEKEDHEFVEWMDKKTYEIAPDILILVLAARKSIDATTVKKIQHGFKTGNYDLTDQEISEIMKAAIALSLQEYVEGLLIPDNDGQTIGHRAEFLKYCDWYRKDLEKYHLDFPILDKVAEKLAAEKETNPAKGKSLEEFARYLISLNN